MVAGAGAGSRGERGVCIGTLQKGKTLVQGFPKQSMAIYYLATNVCMEQTFVYKVNYLPRLVILANDNIARMLIRFKIIPLCLCGTVGGGAADTDCTGQVQRRPNCQV